MRLFGSSPLHPREAPRPLAPLKHPWIWAVVATGLSMALWALSLPPFNFAELAYVALIPCLLCISRGVPRKPFLITAFVASWLAWIVVLIWLRHVTFFGTIALSGILALFFLAWCTVAHAVLPKLAGTAFFNRLLAFLGLAGVWVFLEWLRTFLLSGFPWAPLALSQWERPVALQVAAWTGFYGVSFLLVLFNLSIGWTLRNRLFFPRHKALTTWLSPDLYLALGLLLGAIMLFFKTLPERAEQTEFFRAGFVQPYIPANVKWDPEEATENLDILSRQTRFVGSLEPEVVLWPEASTPWPVLGGYPEMREWVEQASRVLEVPILMGNLAVDREHEQWFNAAFVVTPEEGLREAFYAKRKLVPFGEFIPFRGLLGFIDKFVPIGSDFTPGPGPELLPLEIANGRTLEVGVLICYEDIFPQLARSSAQAGADIFFVATNNAWYGEEGGAYQHAAHAALRAVETRRPVVRVGNGGWSGWFDSFGAVREVMLDEHGSIYFRGGGTAEVFQYTYWDGRQSFYVRYGNWFVGLSALFALALVRYRA